MKLPSTLSFIIRCLPAVFLLPETILASDAPRPDKPNFVLILADDLGWQDLGCYDIDEEAPMDTPNLDALAEKGVLFWQGYSAAPTCSASRVAIMTGKHPARLHKTHNNGGVPPHPKNGPKDRMMEPFFSGRLVTKHPVLSRSLMRNGYHAGHSGKWHMSISGGAYPEPKDVGFIYSHTNRGSHTLMEDRLLNFATNSPDDPFRLDKRGFPHDQTNEDALFFLREYSNKPFFLFYAPYLVHAPMQTRSPGLLKKYVTKLDADPKKIPGIRRRGQINPFYAAMVEELDYHVGKVIDYLEETEDPRWAGHKLIENTYIIFTSDNGGAEGRWTERFTDNKPLNKGKMSLKEGGVRVPLIIAGPGISAGKETDVMANGMDFYPTILSLAGLPMPGEKVFDGCDLAPLLLNNVNNTNLVKDEDGEVRKSMVWHFPHGNTMQSSIREGDFKLIRNYDSINNPRTPILELYRIYNSRGGSQRRADIEESRNLVTRYPQLARIMQEKLAKSLQEMKAVYPAYNPSYRHNLPHKKAAPKVLSHSIEGDQVTIKYQENGSKVTGARLIYSLNGAQRFEEWKAKGIRVDETDELKVTLPEGTTHFYINLIDEKYYLVSYPKVAIAKVRGRTSYIRGALKP